MSQPFLAEIRIFPYNFAPRGWRDCNGDLIPIQQNTALFSLIGTFYGGNGQSNFALPDFRGYTAMSVGQGPGLQQYSMGEQVGSSTETLTINEMPAHVHVPNAKVDLNNANMHRVPVAGDQLTRFGKSPSGLGFGYTKPPQVGTVLMAPQMVQVAGGNQPHQNMQPYLALRYCIAVEGIFPARN